jgi:hypothetical protein
MRRTWGQAAAAGGLMGTAGGNPASAMYAGRLRPPGGRAVVPVSGTAVWVTLAGAAASPATAGPAIARAAPGTAAMTMSRAGPLAVTRRNTQVHRPGGDPPSPCLPKAADATTRVLRGGSPPTISPRPTTRLWTSPPQTTALPTTRRPAMPPRTTRRPATGPRVTRPRKPARRRASTRRTTSPPASCPRSPRRPVSDSGGVSQGRTSSRRRQEPLAPIARQAR